jgi:hypothetical protein
MAESKKTEIAEKGKAQASLVVNNAFIDGLSAQLAEKAKYGLSFPKDYNPTNALTGAYLIMKETADKNGKCILESCSQTSIANSLMDMVTLGLNATKKQGYFIAYGVVRFVLEPLRNPAFIMGTSDVTSERSGYKSYDMALAFIIIGIVLIIVNHVLDYLAKKNKFDKVLWLKHLYVQELDVVAVDHISEENTSSQEEDDDSIDLSKLKAKEKELQDNN